MSAELPQQPTDVAEASTSITPTVEDAEIVENFDKELQLLQACIIGDEALVEQLIDDEDVDICHRDAEGRSPLHLACQNGHFGIVELLLSAGHPWNVVDAKSVSAGEYAQKAKHLDIAERLIDEGCRAEMLLNLLERKQKDTSTAPNMEYLQQPLQYLQDKLVDAEGNGVMMGWEGPLMEAHAKVICPTEGLDVINIGFGLGLIDSALQKLKPRTHTIVEAHPDVYKHMLATGWDKKPGVIIVFGRWQEVLSQLTTYDGIFFDTFGEFYDDLKEWHDYVPQLLRPNGIYSFFNGLAATNSFFHEVYCRIVEMELHSLGLNTEYTEVAIDANQPETWDGITRKYFSLTTYYLPVCRHLRLQQDEDADADADADAAVDAAAAEVDAAVSVAVDEVEEVGAPTKKQRTE